MFYPELYHIFKDKSAMSQELIESIDRWFAFLPINQKDKITVGRFSKIFRLDYNISRGILEKLSEENFLKRIFAIRCENCGFVLKMSDEQNLYEDIIALKSHNDCYNCDDKIGDIKFEDVEVRYELITKPTNDPHSIKKETFELLGVKEKSNDKIKDLLEKANYDSNKLFYNPTEGQYEELDKLFCGVLNAVTTKEKGDTLEYFSKYLLELIKPIKATPKAKTNTNQLDEFVVNNGIGFNPVLDKMGHVFICECKNEGKAPANGYFHKLANILNTSTVNRNEEKFGIIFSKEAPPSTYLEMARKTYYTTNTTIITFFKDELKEVIYDKVNLLGYIDYKINLVQKDLIENEELKSVFL